ncbi:MAG: glycine cleavage system protein GcvH [Candidatus Thalassarchaeaceae archaeon]|jgi:glycine cleavage system H protein|nr:glycine cleavage system protein GcvH [Candidatus Thalassarchaeaceae archaeon]MDP6703276.1 glycine cleavage system protein GcvH [Candidatus Thalassarchaeaceae archaeon]MDP7004047.1 glycine cleavage system protein GcvH [Candidatus Thalassarchaeaceae archaeon]
MGVIPKDLSYTEEHEWIRRDGDEVVVGITDFAQEMLTAVVWVELPEVGTEPSAMEGFASLESVKSVSSIHAPVSGKVVAVNENLEDCPEKINEDPYGEGWICRIAVSQGAELDGLLDAAGYTALIGE